MKQICHAIFEATHGTPPKYADLDQVNPGSVILSGGPPMMLRYNFRGAGDAIIRHMGPPNKTASEPEMAMR